MTEPIETPDVEPEFTRTLDAIMCIECEDDASEERQIAAWQYLLDDGIVWKLQGFYVRGARALLDAGLIIDNHTQS